MRKTAESNGSRKVMSVIVLALLLAIVLATVVSAAWTDKLSGLGEKFSGLSSSKWIVIIVNGALLAGIGYLVVVLRIKKEDIKSQQNFIILVIVGISLLIGYLMYESDSNMKEFLWKLPVVKDFLHAKVLVNLASVIFVLYVLYFWLLTPDEKKEENRLFDFMILAIIVIMAVNVVKPIPSFNKDKYHYIWEWESVAPYKFKLLGDPNCVYYDFDDNGWQDGGRIWKDKTANKYYFDEKTNTWEKQETLLWLDFLYPDSKPDNAKVEELKLAQKVKETGTTDVNKLDKDKRNEYFADKEKLAGFASEKKVIDRYCYTQKSIDEYLQNRGKTGELSHKEPTLDEIRSTGGFGILRGMHLIMLIFGSIVLAWVMQVWEVIKTGDEKKKDKLRYVLAILVAAIIAHSGVSMQVFVWLAQLLIMLGMFKVFGGDQNKLFSEEPEFGSWFAVVVPIMLVNYIAEAINPIYSLPIIGWLSLSYIYSMFSSPGEFAIGILQIMAIIYVGLFTKLNKLIKGIIIFVLLYIPRLLIGQYALSWASGSKMLGTIGMIVLIWIIISRVKKRAKDKKKKLESMLYKRGYAYIENYIRDWLNEGTLPIMIKRIIASWKGEEPSKTPEADIPGLLPFYVQQNLPFFYHLFNLCKRTWIYHAYWSVVKGLFEITPEMEEKGDSTSEVDKIRKGIGKYTNRKQLMKAIINYRSAPCNWLSVYKYKVHPDQAEDSLFSGWTSYTPKLVKVYNKSLDILTQAKIALEIGDYEGFQHYKAEFDGLTAQVPSLIKHVKEAFQGLGENDPQERGYLGRLDSYSWHHKLKSNVTFAMLMANPAYIYPHSYTFADPKAELKDSTEKAGWLIENDRYKEVTSGGEFIDDSSDLIHGWSDARQVYEVDFTKNFSTLTIDADGKKIISKIAKRVRQLKDPRNVITFMDNVPGHDFEQILRWMWVDWDLWLKDMEYGLYHQKSRSWLDYRTAYASLNYHDGHITKGRTIDFNNPSFDLRLLNNPGLWQYWGRRYYYEKLDDCEKNNPFPWISLVGMTEFLAYEFKRSFGDAHHRLETAALFPAVDNPENARELITTLDKILQNEKK